jgi:hypothetical protein
MKVIIDNAIIKEILHHLVKDKAIIEDFALYTDTNIYCEYCFTSQGIRNLRENFYSSSDFNKCLEPSILNNLGLPERVYFDKLLIEDIDTQIQYKEKSNKDLDIYLQETYFKTIKESLKYSDSTGYHDFIYISEYQIDEHFPLLFKNIKYKQFYSFKEFVEQYCNSFKYLEDSWIKNAFESINVYEFNNPVSIEPNDIFPYVEEVDSMLKDADINKYSRKYHGLTISEIEVLKCSTTNDNYNIFLDFEGNARISVDCDIEVGYKLYVSKPKDFIEDDEFGSWDEYLSDILHGCLSLKEYFEDDGYCGRESDLRGEISILVKDKIILESNLGNCR